MPNNKGHKKSVKDGFFRVRFCFILPDGSKYHKHYLLLDPDDVEARYTDYTLRTTNPTKWFTQICLTQEIDKAKLFSKGQVLRFRKSLPALLNKINAKDSWCPGYNPRQSSSDIRFMVERLWIN